MRHVPVAEFKDKLSSFLAAAEAGEEIVITRHGRERARLLPAQAEDSDARRQSFARLARLRQQARAAGGTVTGGEVRTWIDEGRP